MGNIIQRFFSFDFPDDDRQQLILMYDKLQKFDDFDDDNDDHVLDDDTS